MKTMKPRNHQRAVLLFLQGAGAAHVHLESGGRGHPRLVFTFGGREYREPIGSSPRDIDAAKKKISDLKRLLRGAGHAEGNAA